MRKIISLAVALGAVAAFAAMLVWLAPSTLADNAPDWMRAAAQDKLPEYPKETVAVMLLDDVQTVVKDNGEIETRTRLAYKLLRPGAREEYGQAVVHFDNETKITYLKAWTIRASGEAIEVKEKDAVDVAASDYEVFSDQRFKFLKFPEAEAGSGKREAWLATRWCKSSGPSCLTEIGISNNPSQSGERDSRCSFDPAGNSARSGKIMQKKNRKRLA